MTTETSILLPTAGVDLFIRDKETIEAARSLAEDWRFARVVVNVEEGDVETAINAYQETTSPALLIIETDTTDESFIERLEALSAHCAEGTNAIIIGPVNDVNLYRSLTSMGVTDYLVRPVPVDTLGEVIASTLIEQLGATGSRLIGVVGAKGGVGVSSLTQGMAWGLSEILGQKTVLLDAAGGWSTLSVGMGFDPAATLHEAVRAASNKDEDTLKRMLHKANDKLSVLATGVDAMLEASVNAQQYEELLDMVMTSYPVTLVDLSAAIPSLRRTVIQRAHELIVVSTPTLPSLRAARTLMQEIKTLHGGTVDGVDLIVNMQGLSPSREVSKGDIAASLDKTPSAIVPFDPKLFIGSENEGHKLTDDKEGLGIVQTLLPLAQKVISGGADLPSGDANNDGAGVLGQFLTKLSKKK